jgi:hypothetical protein
MAASRKGRKTEEFGDFQTPASLARQVCKLLAARRVAPTSILEPTCGAGSFLLAALDHFPGLKRALGVEINPDHVNRLTAALRLRSDAAKVQIVQGDFFAFDWPKHLADFPDPILVLGNPPWVTNARLGALRGKNLPKKSNFQNHSGLDAVTGKSNFDISEWMLIRILELLAGRQATIAMLCKSAVARKVLAHAWKNGITLGGADVYSIDAEERFGASVEACLLVCALAPSPGPRQCRVYSSLKDDQPERAIGYEGGQLIADLPAYQRWRHLEGRSPYAWRSGIKHDCARVMELRKEGSRYRNGLGELVELEDDFLYPMLKGSELANGRVQRPRRWMIVPQKAVGDDTAFLRVQAPKTWRYLQEHGEALDRRASSIYRKRPRFAVFGVGPYSFSPWKVAIAGLYKKLHFTVVGSVAGKPIVLDDTCAFVACESEEEAAFLAGLLGSPAAQEFLSSLVFWDAKRPVTIELLRRLNVLALARACGASGALARPLPPTGRLGSPQQKSLFETEAAPLSP